MKERKKIITLLRDFANFIKPNLLWVMHKASSQLNPNAYPIYVFEVIISIITGALLTELLPMYVFDRLGLNGVLGYFVRFLIFFYFTWLNLGNLNLNKSYSIHVNTFAVIFYKLFMAASIVSVVAVFYHDNVESVFWFFLASTTSHIFYMYTPDKKDENND